MKSQQKFTLFIVLQVICCTSLWSGLVMAQSAMWLEDRKNTQGRGIRLGDFELHPGIGAEVGYDSNVFLTKDGNQGSAVLRVTPHLALSTLTSERTNAEGVVVAPRKLDLLANVHGSYYRYFQSDILSNVEIGADINAKVNASDSFFIVAYDKFDRTMRPFAAQLSGIRVNYARNTNVLGLDLGLRTKSGILQGTLGYLFGFDFFDSSIFQFGNSIKHGIKGSAAWTFFPSTSLIYDVNLNFQNYTGNQIAQNPLVSSNTLVQSRVGLNGALTQRLSMSVLAGYAAGFYERGDSFDTFVGTIETRWAASDTFTLISGISRDAASSLVGNYFITTRGYISPTLMIGRVVLTRAEVGVALFDFGHLINRSGADLGNTPERTDVRAYGKLYGEYRLTNWFALNGTLGYSQQFTNYKYSAPTSEGTVIVVPAEFSKFEAFAGVRAFY